MRHQHLRLRELVNATKAQFEEGYRFNVRMVKHGGYEVSYRAHDLYYLKGLAADLRALVNAWSTANFHRFRRASRCDGKYAEAASLRWRNIQAPPRRGAAGRLMFVHSLWAETSAPLQDFANRASTLLGPPGVVEERRLQWPREIHASVDPTDPDMAWEQPLGKPSTVRQAVAIYRIESYVGIASADPTINFRLRDDFDKSFKITAPTLNWAANRPQSVGDWSLCAIHFRDPSSDIELISQGGQESRSELVRQIDRFNGYNIFGVSLAGLQGSVVTLYEEGQIWLQQVLPEDIPEILTPILAELLSENYYA
jgi:hypothetical protein